MKNNYFLKQEKTVVRSMKLFYIFKISLKSELAEDSWILLSASAFNLLWYVVLVEADKENLASLRYVVQKGRSILIAFSYNYEYSSLITIPKLKRW